MNLDSYLALVKRGLDENQKLLPLLSINPLEASHLASLQQNLQGISDKQITAIVDKCNFSWPSFESFIESYLRFTSDVDPWSLLNSIDYMIEVMGSLSIALNTKNPSWLLLLLPVLEEYIKILIPLSKLVDNESLKLKNWSDDYPRLSEISNILLKCLNNIRSDPDINQPSNKIKIVSLFNVCISLCNVYFSIDRHILCNNVFSNMNVLQLDVQLIQFKQLLQYRFIVGKFYSQQAQYTPAYNHLNWCYENLPTKCGIVDRVKILKYLLPVGLLVGKIPDIHVLHKLITSSVANKDATSARYFLNSILPLISAYKKGDFLRTSLIISKHENIWQKFGLWVGLTQRLKLLITRNLLVRVYMLKNKTLNISDIKIALDVSIGCKIETGESLVPYIYQMIENLTPSGVERSTVENLIGLLVSNGLLKAKLQAGSNILVMSKDKPFPPVFDVYMTNNPLPSKEAWLNINV
ncbi:Thp1 protein [Martiniozyma asiatica (nom. inval.)]|nr:Thp1 protein [Martiniozyma asiatica]